MKMTMKMTMNSTHALLNNPSLWTAFVGRTNCQERSDCLVGESLSFAFRIVVPQELVIWRAPCSMLTI